MLTDDKTGNLTERYVNEVGEDRLYKQDGLITLVDYMGGDPTIERVALAGHNSDILGHSGTQDVFQYLHSTKTHEPFKFAQLKFVVKAPISTALTLVYDRNASVNEMSARYSEMPNEWDMPWENSAQYPTELKERLGQGVVNTYTEYINLLEQNLARELARGVLGTNLHTSFVWKNDLLSIRQLYDRHGDLERNSALGQVIHAMAHVASEMYPLAWRVLGTSPHHPNLVFPTDESIVDPSLQPSEWGVQPTKRVIAPMLEERLFEPLPILDHGAVQFTDYMGNERAAADAARISYGKGTRKLQDDLALTNTLIRDRHTSPVEMIELAAEYKTPLFVFPRQGGRHRTMNFQHFLNIIPVGSQFYIPPENELRHQDRKNRQGRAELIEPSEVRIAIQERIKATLEEQMNSVPSLRALGVGEDICRSSKGVNAYTRGSLTTDVHNLAHFLGLRLDVHAQKEIRDFAQRLDQGLSWIAPGIHEALRNYRFEAVSFSGSEQQYIRANGWPDPANPDLHSMRGFGLLDPKTEDSDEPKLGRTGIQLLDKVRRFLPITEEQS